MRKKRDTIYVRIGHWRPEEISFNYATGSVEIGVSVFEAVQQGDRFRILLDEEHDPDNRQADTLSGWAERLYGEVRRGKPQTPIFIVDGDYIGVGYDGEPLLKRLEVVREISVADLLAPEIGLR